MTEQPPIKNLKEVKKKWQQIIDEIQDTECGGETWDYLSEWSSEAGTAQYALWRGCQRIVKLSCEINEQINLIYPHPIKDCTATSAEKVLKLSKGELFHLECMIEEELKGLIGQAKNRCPLCRAMLKKIKSLEVNHDETL